MVPPSHPHTSAHWTHASGNAVAERARHESTHNGGISRTRWFVSATHAAKFEGRNAMLRLSTDLKFRYVMLLCAASVTWQVTSSRREARTNVRRNLAILSILARRETGFDCRATLHWPHRGLLAAAAVNDTRTPHPLVPPRGSSIGPQLRYLSTSTGISPLGVATPPTTYEPSRASPSNAARKRPPIIGAPNEFVRDLNFALYCLPSGFDTGCYVWKMIKIRKGMDGLKTETMIFKMCLKKQCG